MQGESESAMDARASQEVNDSDFNCDVWMTRNEITDSQSIVGVPAVAMCRALSPRRHALATFPQQRC